MNEARFSISELFGPTVQGEGSEVGTACVFIRFVGCDSDCRWCDTKYAWQKDHPLYTVERLTTTEIVNRVLVLDPNCRKVILTGGNPALYKRMGELIDRLWQHNIRVSIETQGTIWQGWFNQCDWIVISPKLSNAQLSRPTTYEMIDDVLWKTTSMCALKFVVFGPDDIAEAVDFFNGIYESGGVDELIFSVGTKQEDTVEDLLRRWRVIIAQAEAIAAGRLNREYRVLPQAHVLLWGQKKGV
jgi:7-carboxy-7-deazaguanine synthase